jgi:hypothetical protein
MDAMKKDDLLLSLKYGVDKDPNFSAKRNQMIINRTIMKTDLAKMRKEKEYTESIRERSEAVASFLSHVNEGKHNDVVKYFGRRELARLRGEDIATQIKAKILNKNAKT